MAKLGIDPAAGPDVWGGYMGCGLVPKRASRALWLCGLAVAAGLASAGAVQAQSTPPLPPVHTFIDENGVNLVDGHLHRLAPQSSMGGSGADGLSSQKIIDPHATVPGIPGPAIPAAQDTYTSYLVYSRGDVTTSDGTGVVSLFGQSEVFDAALGPANSGGVFIPHESSGATLEHKNGKLIFRNSAGMTVQFADHNFYPPNWFNLPGTQRYAASPESITFPTGEVLTQTANGDGVSPPTYVESSLGYALDGNRTVTNLKTGQSLPSASDLSRSITVSSPSSGTLVLQSPNSSKTYTFGNAPSYNNAPNTRVTSVTDGRGTWTYAYSDAFDANINTYPEQVDIRTTTLTITDPIGRTKTVVVRYDQGNVLSVQDASGTTIYGYDNDTYRRGYGNLNNVAYQEGNGEHYTLDARGNVTAKYSVPKPNSGLSQTVVQASFPSACDDTNFRICNKPTWVQDELGHQTDFTYDPVHGGVLTETAPAGPNGVRPQTRYTYGQFTAQYVRSGSMQPAGAPVWRLIKTSKCQTQASCAGTSDEVVTTYTYESSSGPNNVRLLSVATTKGDGSVISNDGVASSTTTYTYDFAGNVLTSDGPLPGAADTTTYKYDSSRWKIGEIGPDPDGSGVLQRRATKNAYRNDGTISDVFTGAVSDPSDSTFTNSFQVLQRINHAYDGQGRTVGDVLYGPQGEVISGKNYAYYADGRLWCETTRMNLANVTADACNLGSDVGYGPDRLTIYYYDTSARMYAKYEGTYGQPFKPEFTYFSPNSKPVYIYDGNFNLTYLTYDGLDRLAGKYFGQQTGATGQVDWSDYEYYSYDAANNRTAQRQRDAQIFYYGYDNLNRLVQQTTPANARNVSYTYDSLGRRLRAQGSTTDFNFTYDALGRKLTESGPFGIVTSSYDIAGRRTNLGYPDGFNNWSTFDTVGEPVCQGESGYATSALVCDYYDDLGRRTELGRGNNAHSFYYYDGGSRLTGWSVGRPDVGGADSFGYWYNPAGQHVGKWLNNPAYEFSQGINFDRLYAHDNQNKMTVSGSQAIGYDPRGNLTSAGSTSYTYDIENHLTSISSTGATLDYDSLGRLWRSGLPGQGFTYYIYDGDNLLYELSGNTGGVLRRYVWGLGTDEPLVWYEGAAFGNGSNVDRRWLIGDERGSIVSVTNGSGAPMAFNTYDEYGIPGSGNLGRFQYTGQAWLSGFGLYHYKARAYSPTLGRFMQTDPIGYEDDRNLYSYVKDDPLNRGDPTGTCGVFIAQCIGAGIGVVAEIGFELQTGELQSAIANARGGDWRSLAVSGLKIGLSGTTGALGGTAAKVGIAAAVGTAEVVTGGAVLGSGIGATAEATGVAASQAGLGALSKVASNGIQKKRLSTGVVQAATIGAAVGTFGHYVNGVIGENVAATVGSKLAASLAKKEAGCATGGKHSCTPSNSPVH